MLTACTRLAGFLILLLGVYSVLFSISSPAPFTSSPYPVLQGNGPNGPVKSIALKKFKVSCKPKRVFFLCQPVLPGGSEGCHEDETLHVVWRSSFDPSCPSLDTLH